MGKNKAAQSAGRASPGLGSSVQRTLWLAAIGVAASGLALPAVAQDSESKLTLDEIIVTARKREESLQSTPVAVSAFTTEALAVRNVDSLEKVSQFTPNLQFDGAAALSGGRFNATMFIRGVGQNDFATFSDAGVGMYIDGIYMGRTIGGIMDAVDIARVEVLRGPQGTLFGKNTIGGAINIITQAPTDKLETKVDLTVGQFNRTDIKAMVNIPAADGQFLTRISIAQMQRDGYGKQVDFVTGRVDERGDHNAQVARVQTLWHVSDDFSASLNLDGTRAREHAAPLTLVRVAAVPNPAGYPFFNLYNNLVAPNLSITAPNGLKQMNSSWITGDPYTTYGTFYNINNLDNWGGGLTLDWSLGTTRLKSITGYRRLRADFGRDGDNSPLTFRETFNIDSANQLSQEFQLTGVNFDDKLNWLVGAYYFDEDTVDDGGARLGVGIFNALENPAQQGRWSPPAIAPNAVPCNPLVPGPPCLGGVGNPQNVANDLQIQLHNLNESKSTAIFAQATYKFTDRFSVTPGVRYTHDEKSFSGFQLRLNAHQYIIPPGFVTEDSWSKVSPKLSFEFQATEDVLTYISGSSGYKSGGFNERPLRSISEVNTYEPEDIITYEAGAKTSWFDHRVIWNSAVFYSDYKDIQLTVNQTPLNFVFNAAQGEMKGAESELTARLAAGLDLNLSAGYLSAHYTEIDPAKCPTVAACPITTASSFVKAPKWTASGGVQYSFNTGSGSRITLRGDWAYKSMTFQDVANDPAIAQPGYSLFNARGVWQTADELWEIALFGTNLSDKRYAISGNAASAAFGTLAERTFAPPREWGATVSYRIK
jgi:iron complex outermembrane receptor protein